jgi:hypothetical protein
MNCIIARIAAEGDQDPESGKPEPNRQSQPEVGTGQRKPPRRVESPEDGATGGRIGARMGREIDEQKLRAHQFPSRPVELPRTVEFTPSQPTPGGPPAQGSAYEDPERRVYRGRTVAMLRRYMKYSMETGRLPSVLGKEFFRAKVTSYTVATFEDRVIFVHDMETCLERLDEFSRQLIGRHILQEHDHEGTARLLHCNEKTVRRLVPMVLDQLCEILLDAGLMESLDPNRKKSCQEGESSQIALSRWEDEENKF